MTMLHSLDLFSGVGGMAWGLRDAVTPLMYCDIDSDCRAVLESNMMRGTLPRAPIFNDVKDVTHAIVKNIIQTYPHIIITAGFPCQDISGANSRGVGIHGARSSLFFEVVRIARDIPEVKHIFLENSTCVRTRGLDTIIDALRGIGFNNIVHDTFSASEHVGAPHERKRWFCLATRTGGSSMDDILLDYTDKEDVLTLMGLRNTHFPWYEAMTNVPPVVPRSSRIEERALNARSKMLGNSVVPQCVAYAFLQLLLRNDEDRAYTKNKNMKTTTRYPSLLSVDILSSDDAELVVSTRKTWGTPTATRLQMSHLSSRSICNYGNQVYHSRLTWDHVVQNYPEFRKRCDTPWKVHYHFLINPRFTEAIMGYPSNWTEL